MDMECKGLSGPHTGENTQASEISQPAAAVVTTAAWQQARLPHLSKSDNSKTILTISKTLNQSLFLQ